MVSRLQMEQRTDLHASPLEQAAAVVRACHELLHALRRTLELGTVTRCNGQNIRVPGSLVVSKASLSSAISQEDTILVIMFHN